MENAAFDLAQTGQSVRRTIARRRLFAAFGLALLLPLLPIGSASADEETETFIRTLGDKAVGQLTGDDLTDQERAERFRVLLLEHFDVDQIAQYVLGRYWKVATPEEQAAYLDLFEDYLVSSYSQRFAEYTGEAFEVVSSRAQSDNLEMVRSYVVTRSGEKAKLDWIIERQDGVLLILDLKVEGLSMSETHRSEFASYIQNNGGQVSALLDALRKKTGAS